MLGRYGFIVILVLVLAVTGVLTQDTALGFEMKAQYVPGLVLIAAAAVLIATAGRLTAGMPEEKRKNAESLVKLGALILAGIGAIVVFCG